MNKKLAKGYGIRHISKHAAAEGDDMIKVEEHKAVWIVVTGLDGSGKTNLVNNLAEYYRGKGLRVKTAHLPSIWVRKYFLCSSSLIRTGFCLLLTTTFSLQSWKAGCTSTISLSASAVGSIVSCMEQFRATVMASSVN